MVNWKIQSCLDEEDRVMEHRRSTNEQNVSDGVCGSDDVLNEAFLMDSSANSDNADILNEAFCAEPVIVDSHMNSVVHSVEIQVNSKEFVVDNETQFSISVCEQETQVNGVCDLHVTFMENNDSCYVGNYDVPTQYQALKSELGDLPQPYLLNSHSEIIEILAVCNNDGTTYTRLKVRIDEFGQAVVFTHGKKVESSHRVKEVAPKSFNCKDNVLKLLILLNKFENVCLGNPEEELVALVPVGAGISCAPDQEIIAYREENFNAFQGILKYSSTIRSTSCSLLVEGVRCSSCAKYRRALKQRKERREKLLNKDLDFTTSTYKNSDLLRSVLIKKLEQQKDEINSLQNQVERLERNLKRKISTEGVRLGKIQDLEMMDLMSACESEVQKAFPKVNSHQRLFWRQQLKSLDTSKFGMRWHPMIFFVLLGFTSHRHM